MLLIDVAVAKADLVGDSGNPSKLIHWLTCQRGALPDDFAFLEADGAKKRMTNSVNL